MNAVLQISGSAILAIIPALLWIKIFRSQIHESRRLLLYTFFIGATAVFPILFYKYLWQYFPWINAFHYTEGFQADVIGLSHFVSIPVSVVFTFFIVGFIEEAMKNFAVRVVDDRSTTRNIDDAITMSIVAALGFSFTENIMYFHAIWIQQGMENLLMPFIFRSVFSTFAHIMFSAIFGYYYGISFFAKEYLIANKRTIYWPKKIQAWFGIQKEEIFSISKWVEGFLIAATLHAIYNIFLEMNWTFFLVPFLGIGFFWVNHLLKQKENQKNLGYLVDYTAEEKKESLQSSSQEI
ncbi:MAG: PrsW family glutamic-type intramembrane protease [Patescibacteria group bacterium]|mgnify:CR=1 FL=1